MDPQFSPCNDEQWLTTSSHIFLDSYFQIFPNCMARVKRAPQAWIFGISTELLCVSISGRKKVCLSPDVKERCSLCTNIHGSEAKCAVKPFAISNQHGGTRCWSTEDMPALAMRPTQGPRTFLSHIISWRWRRCLPSSKMGASVKLQCSNAPTSSALLGSSLRSSKIIQDHPRSSKIWFPQCFPISLKAPENLVDSMRDSRPVGWWALNRAWETGRLTVPGMFLRPKGSWQFSLIFMG